MLRRARPGLEVVTAVAAVILCLLALAPGAHAATSPSHSISGAPQLTVGSAGGTESGGHHQIDFWKVRLNGGDQLVIDVAPSVNGTAYRFELYAPGTTDDVAGAKLPFSGPGSAPPVSAVTNGGASPGQVIVQAPYTGNFVLAVCQFGNGGSYGNEDCRNADPPAGGAPTGAAQAPMSPYTFTTSVNAVTAAQATSESRATQTIAGAPSAPSLSAASGAFEAGGGSNIDFWKVRLNGGDQLVIDLRDFVPSVAYRFELYAPETTDGNFASPSSSPPIIAETNGGVSPQQLILQAPYTGTFVLAVCQFGNGGGYGNEDCRNANPPGGAAPTGAAQTPMLPYTFSTSVNAVPAGQVATENRATQTIAGAPALGDGSFETGGGANIDFWTVQLAAGDQLAVNLSTFVSGVADRVELYAPGTTDDGLPGTTLPFSGPASAPPVSAQTNGGTSPDQLTLVAPASGTYVLAVCQFGNGGGYGDEDCRNAAPPGGAAPSGAAEAPISPYTFAVSVLPAAATATALQCAPAALLTGASTTCTATVADTVSGGPVPTGSVAFSAAPSGGSFEGSPSCTLSSTSSGAAGCAVSFTPAAGATTVSAAYAGDVDHLASGASAGVSASSPVVVDETSAEVRCAPESLRVGSATTCTATVTDESDTPTAPSGSVEFGASAKGAFASAGECTLGGSSASSACAVTFTPAASGEDTITATYGGDAGHDSSSDAETITASAVPHAHIKPAPRARITGHTQQAMVSRTGRLAVRVSCHNAPCSGRITLTATTRVRRGKRVVTTTTTLAIARFRALAPGSHRVSLRLDRAGRRLLAHGHRRLSSTARLTLTTGASTTPVRVKVSLQRSRPRQTRRSVAGG